MAEKQKVAIREVQTFVTDDARHLRVYKKVGTVDAAESSDGVPDIDAEKDALYAGNATLEDPTTGETMTVPFPIEATSIDDAYAKYESERDKAVARIQEQVRERLRIMQEAMKQPKIVAASSDALKTIDNARRIISGS